MTLLTAIEPDTSLHPELETVLKRRISYLASRANHVMKRLEAESTSDSWRHKMTAATLFQEAAETAATVGKFKDARDYLGKAVDLLLQLNLPFGVVLQRTFLPKQGELVDPANQVQNSWERHFLRALDSNKENPDLFADIKPDAEGALPGARQSQQQWAYVLLNAAISNSNKDNFTLNSVRKSHCLTKQSPVGRMRLPMENYLLICDLITDPNWEVKYPNVMKVIGESMIGLYRAVQSARENTYLWKSMLAPTPLFDLDTAVLVSTVISAKKEITDQLTQSLSSAIPDGLPNYAEEFLTAVKGLRTQE